jgi:hypothetical protein
VPEAQLTTNQWSYRAFTCGGAAAGLLVAMVLPGSHDLSDAKTALAIGAVAGYVVGWMLGRALRAPRVAKIARMSFYGLGSGVVAYSVGFYAIMFGIRADHDVLREAALRVDTYLYHPLLVVAQKRNPFLLTIYLHRYRFMCKGHEHRCSVEPVRVPHSIFLAGAEVELVGEDKKKPAP